MTDVDRYLASLEDPRQMRIRHHMDVIETAAPGLPIRLWDYSGGVIGYGHYHYRYASGRTGEFFMIGVSSRKRYVAIYTNAASGQGYLAETYEDRLPECKIGKSCIEAPDKTVIADDVLADLVTQSVVYFRTEFEKPKTPNSLQLWE